MCAYVFGDTGTGNILRWCPFQISGGEHLHCSLDAVTLPTHLNSPGIAVAQTWVNLAVDRLEVWFATLTMMRPLLYLE